MGDDIPNDNWLNQRRFPRADISLLVQHRFSSLQEFATRHASDLSLGGIFLRTDERREEGALVYLQFKLDNGERLVEGLGRVVHVTPPGDPSGKPAGLGIEFVNFDPASLELIERIVTEHLSRNAK